MERDQDRPETVISMAGFEKAHGVRISAALRAYWEALRKGRDVPMRSEIDPRGIETALEYAFIIERIAPGMARLRIAGMHLNDLMGMEVRGMPLTALFAPIGRKTVAEALEACFNGPNVVEMVLQAETGMGKPPMSARLILLPLKSDLGDVNRALGCLIADGQIGRTPRRFEVTAVSLSPVVAGAPVPCSLPEPVTPIIAQASTTADSPRPQPRLQAPSRPDFKELDLQSASQKASQKAAPLTPEERRAMMRIVPTS